jgi:hypothetical protein
MRALLLFLLAGCSNSSMAIPDAGAPVDMHIAEPTMLAPASTLTPCLAIDASNVYWSDYSNNVASIMRVPLAGGTATQVIADGDKYACVVTDGNGSVYYTNGNRTIIMKASITGGGSTQVATGQNVLKGSPLVFSGGWLYWITDVYGDVDAYNGKDAIVRLSTNGGAVQVIDAEVTGSPGGLAVDDTSIYYSDSVGVYARPLSMPTTAVSFALQSSVHPSTLALGAGHLAVSEATGIGSGDIAVFRADGTGRTVVSQSLGTPLAVDARGVYTSVNGGLERLALDGSGPSPLAS